MREQSPPLPHTPTTASRAPFLEFSSGRPLGNRRSRSSKAGRVAFSVEKFVHCSGKCSVAYEDAEADTGRRSPQDLDEDDNAGAYKGQTRRRRRDDDHVSGFGDSCGLLWIGSGTLSEGGGGLLMWRQGYHRVLSRPGHVRMQGSERATVGTNLVCDSLEGKLESWFRRSFDSSTCVWCGMCGYRKCFHYVLLSFPFFCERVFSRAEARGRIHQILEFEAFSCKFL